MMLMEQTMGWFGPVDPASLMNIRQSGAIGVVNSLHDIPYGEVWSAEAVAHHRKLIQNADLAGGLFG